MTERPVQIQTPAGIADGFLYQAEGHVPRPGILHLTDIFGIRPANQDMARRQAEAGYTVLLPNVFYRTSPLPLFDFEANFADERTKKRLAELRDPLTPEAQVLDAAAYLDFLAAQPSVKSGPMAVVGYCFTGAMALRTAAAQPARIAAAASFHGGNLYTDEASSPHHLLAPITAALYIGHAKEDRTMPAEAIQKLDQALQAWGGRFESETYDARHGWTVPSASAYHPAEADRAHHKLIDLFRATLD